MQRAEACSQAKTPAHPRGSLLDEPRYLGFLQRSHPELDISPDRFELPSFIAPLDVREPLLPGVFRSLVEVGLRLIPSQVTPRTLFLGTPFERYDQTELVRTVAAPADLVRRALAFGAGRGLDLLVVTCVRPGDVDLEPWTDAGFHVLPSFPDTVVPLTGDHLDTHLRTLSAEDRSGIRRNIRRFERAGHRLVPLRQAEPEASALYACYRPMFERATVRWLPHTQAYFAGIASLDPRVRVTVARSREDELLGFVINFEDGDAFHAGRIGIRPDHYRRDAVYFRLLYHVLEESLEAGAHRLVLEPTGYRMKRHLGARRRRLVNLVQGISPTWRLLLSSLRGLSRRALSHLDNRRILERRY